MKDLKYIERFTESIIQSKIEYLKDLYFDFFDEYNQFEFRIVNGCVRHSYTSLLPLENGNSPIDTYGCRENPEKYIFLYIYKIDKLEFDKTDINILSNFDHYLINAQFRFRSMSSGDIFRLYKFDKYNKNQKYF